MKYQIEMDSNMELDVLVPRHIESDNALEVVEEVLNGVLKMLGVKMSVTGYEYHEDTGNYKFEIRHN